MPLDRPLDRAGLITSVALLKAAHKFFAFAARPEPVSALQLLQEFGLKSDPVAAVTSRIPESQVIDLDQIAASAGVSRSRMAAALLQDGLRRYGHEG